MHALETIKCNIPKLQKKTKLLLWKSSQHQEEEDHQAVNRVEQLKNDCHCNDITAVGIWSWPAFADVVVEGTEVEFVLQTNNQNKKPHKHMKMFPRELPVTVTNRQQRS